MRASSSAVQCACGRSLPAPMRVDSRNAMVCPHCDRVWIGVPDAAGGWWRQAGQRYSGQPHRVTVPGSDLTNEREIDPFDMPMSLSGDNDPASDLTGAMLLGYDLGRVCRVAGYWRRAAEKRSAALVQADQLLQDEFGGMYESAPFDSPLGIARRVLRTQRADDQKKEPQP